VVTVKPVEPAARGTSKPSKKGKGKPLGKREAKRQAKWQRQEALRAKGEQAAKDLLAKDRNAARWLYDVLREFSSYEAFVDELEDAFREEFEEADHNAGNDADPTISAEARKVRHAEEGDIEEESETERPRRRRKVKEVETTLEQAVADAFTDLSSLGEECRDAVDNAPDNLRETQRNQTLEETADELGNLEQPDVPPELAELPVKYLPLTKSRPSRVGFAVSRELALIRKCDFAYQCGAQ
jgi:hypothetical protein